MITIEEYTDILKSKKYLVTKSFIRTLCQNGKIPAKKFYKAWVILDKDFVPEEVKEEDDIKDRWSKKDISRIYGRSITSLNLDLHIHRNHFDFSLSYYPTKGNVGYYKKEEIKKMYAKKGIQPVVPIN